jgi:hypothetical protein
LAKGTSTIGLEAKKLSGAQRRKLTRERKMREETWTERKSPRGIPLTSDRSAAESSRGVQKTPLGFQHTDNRDTATEETQ